MHFHGHPKTFPFWRFRGASGHHDVHAHGCHGDMAENVCERSFNQEQLHFDRTVLLQVYPSLEPSSLASLERLNTLC